MQVRDQQLISIQEIQDARHSGDYIRERFSFWPKDVKTAIKEIENHNDGDTMVLVADLRKEEEGGFYKAAAMLGHFGIDQVINPNGIKTVTSPKNRKFIETVNGVAEVISGLVVIHSRQVILPRELDAGIPIAALTMAVSTVKAYRLHLDELAKLGESYPEGIMKTDEFGNELRETYNLDEINLVRAVIAD